MSASPVSPNGFPARRNDGKVRVAIIGVGNCASSLVQGVQYYQNAPEDEFVPGLMHVNLGGYHIRDVEFSAAFEVDSEKVGKDLSEAIRSGPNNTITFAQVPHLGVTVHRGPTMDGIGKYLSEVITESDAPAADIAQILRDTQTDVVVSYLPVPRRRRAGTSSRSSRPAVPSSTASRSSSPGSRNGPRSSSTAACRSSATTSRARSAPRSPTGC